MAKEPLTTQVLNFSYGIIKICSSLDDIRQHVIARQLMAAGTSVGACVFEAQQAESRADFIHKMKISSKEACETLYWLHLSNRLVEVEQTMFEQLESIQKIINKSIVTAKQNLRQ